VPLHQNEAEEALAHLLCWSLLGAIRKQELSLPTNRKMRISTQPKYSMTRTDISVDPRDRRSHRGLRLKPQDAPTKRSREKDHRDAPTISSSSNLMKLLGSQQSRVKHYRDTSTKQPWVRPYRTKQPWVRPYREVPVSAFHSAVDVNREPVGSENDEPPSPRGEGRGDVGSGSRYDQLNRQRWARRVWESSEGTSINVKTEWSLCNQPDSGKWNLCPPQLLDAVVISCPRTEKS
jgi:hypothetical protein